LGRRRGTSCASWGCISCPAFRSAGRLSLDVRFVDRERQRPDTSTSATLLRRMSVRLRLTRVGGKKDPIWRVVVADQRPPRDGRVIETVGRYHPQTDPSTIVPDEERVRTWLARGAQPSHTVRKLLRTQGIDS